MAYKVILKPSADMALSKLDIQRRIVSALDATVSITRTI